MFEKDREERKSTLNDNVQDLQPIYL